MKKSILLLLCLFFYFAQANSQTITGSPSVCVGGISMLSCSPGGGTWTSSAVSVATVNSAGIVTGVSGGTAIISYGYPVPLDTMVVTVTATAGAITGASSSCVGASTTLSCAVSGGTWSSSNPAVASVGTSGVVAGLVAGTATITYMPPWGVCPSTTVYAATTCCSGTPAPGVVVPNVTAGCASTPISLNDTGATPGDLKFLRVYRFDCAYLLPSQSYLWFQRIVFFLAGNQDQQFCVLRRRACGRNSVCQYFLLQRLFSFVAPFRCDCES
jgi:hypothetical protein